MRKQVVTFTLAGVLALGIVGCSQQSTETKTESEAQPKEQTTQVEQVENATNWTSAADADAAAKGAGLNKFGVFEELTFHETTYKNPKFAYADGVAKATYDGGAHELVVTKGANGHKAPLTERNKTEFANKWTATFDGVDVTLYGPEQGAAVVITWADGTGDYGVTYQGLGGEEITLTNEDVTAIVSAMKAANAENKTEEKKAEENKAEEKKTDQQQQQQPQQEQQSNNSANNNNNAGSSNNGGSSDTAGMTANYGAESCIQIACDYAGAGGQAKGSAMNVSCSDLITGGGTLYYVVDFDLGDVHYNVQVDAVDGNVISGSETFNGTEQLLDEEGDPVPNTEQPADDE